jgi:hypothetical protein
LLNRLGIRHIWIFHIRNHSQTVGAGF